MSTSLAAPAGAQQLEPVDAAFLPRRGSFYQGMGGNPTVGAVGEDTDAPAPPVDAPMQEQFVAGLTSPRLFVPLPIVRVHLLLSRRI